ncbi:hypothetical protein AAG906_000753 [Vitis piasezkii]
MDVISLPLPVSDVNLDYDIREEVDPTTYCEALNSDKTIEWLIAMRDEMQSMSNNDVWELVDLPKGYKPIGCKWIFKTKRDNKGNTFPLVSTKDSFRLIMALVAHFDLKLHRMDVKTSFLNGDLSEENKFDQCVYMKVNGSKYIFMVLYIDDILLASSNVNLLNDTKPYFVLGIEIYRDRSRNLLGLSREPISIVCLKDSICTCKAGDCPKNDLEKDAMKTIPYASVVGSLMYAQVCTRLDIAFIVNVLGLQDDCIKYIFEMELEDIEEPANDVENDGAGHHVCALLPNVVNDECSSSHIIAFHFAFGDNLEASIKSIEDSLHYIDPSSRFNAYQHAIMDVGEVIQFYDFDSGVEVERVQGIMATYASALNHVALTGLTLFGQVINNVVEIAGQSLYYNSCKYFVLLIITDGMLTDLQDTKDALVRASDLPLSILIVGMGGAHF